MPATTSRICPGSVLHLNCGEYMSIGLRNRRVPDTNWAQWGLRLHAGERVLVVTVVTTPVFEPDMLVLVRDGRMGWTWSNDAVWSTA